MKLAILLFILLVLFFFGAALLIHSMYTGEIKDKDKDFIPDVIEDRLDRVAEEINDIAQDISDAIDGVDDVVEAAKGSKRRGRPKNNTSNE